MDDSRPLTLRDVALAASQRVGGLRGRELGRQAEKRGLTLSYTTVDKIIAGTYTSRPKPKTLDALSELSGISRALVYDAAGVPMPLSPLAELLPPDADILSPEQRKAVIAVVREFARMQRLLHGQEQERDGDERDAATNERAGGSPARFVHITEAQAAQGWGDYDHAAEAEEEQFATPVEGSPEHDLMVARNAAAHGLHVAHGTLADTGPDFVVRHPDGFAVVIEAKNLQGARPRPAVLEVQNYDQLLRVVTAAAHHDPHELERELVEIEHYANDPETREAPPAQRAVRRFPPPKLASSVADALPDDVVEADPDAFDLAARPGVSRGQLLREEQDRMQEAPDPAGPEAGA